MKKYFLKTIILFAMVAIAFTSCKDEDYTGASTLTASKAKATVEWTAPASLVEKDTVFPFTITLSEPQIVDIVISISVLESTTAKENSDFTIPHTLTIPAYETSVSGEFKVIQDSDFEETEVVNIQFGGGKTANVELMETKSVEIKNFVEDAVSLSFDWDQTIDITVGGTLYEGVSLCATVDIDLTLRTEDGTDLQDYQAATGSCPEVFKFNSATWAHGDGTFYLATMLWKNGGVVPDEGIQTYPIKTTFVQAGVFSNGPFPQPESTVFDSTTPTDWGNTPQNIIKVEVANGKFTFKDAVTGDVLAQQQ